VSAHKKTAIIIGAGPAGLTAALELLRRTDVHPIVLEATDQVGGIARTVNFKGNRIDIGGHRFFSKSTRVMNWWLDILPLQHVNGQFGESFKITYRNMTRDLAVRQPGPDPDHEERVMLIRKRMSRILYRRRFFDYPLSLTPKTLMNLGLVNVMRVGLSYVRARIAPIQPEKSLEDFFINRFGRELYLTFFKDYTEKVWGVPCTQITPDWGAQRIKGLSISKAILDALRRTFKVGRNGAAGKTETSLIQYFLYPKYGPGQMWEEVAEQIRQRGGEIRMRSTVVGVDANGHRVRSVQVRDEAAGSVERLNGDYILSTMPVKDLVRSMDGTVPMAVKRAAGSLQYRDFITVGLLFKKLITPEGALPDSWIYVQERDVKVGRIQVFNNWSPYLVRSHDATWLGLEYFCQEGDDLWTSSDAELLNLGVSELCSLRLANRADFIDGVVLRMPKAYPGYFGGYEEFPDVQKFLDGYENLFLIGRNGMHKYNNMDHSMLTAMAAVDNIVANVRTKENIWSVNAEAEYHEEGAQR
jgi:protoporphyrinogen oxidase